MTKTVRYFSVNHPLKLDAISVGVTSVLFVLVLRDKMPFPSQRIRRNEAGFQRLEGKVFQCQMKDIRFFLEETGL